MQLEADPGGLVATGTAMLTEPARGCEAVRQEFPLSCRSTKPTRTVAEANSGCWAGLDEDPIGGSGLAANLAVLFQGGDVHRLASE